jgi:hypothetical protein
MTSRNIDSMTAAFLLGYEIGKVTKKTDLTLRQAREMAPVLSDHELDCFINGYNDAQGNDDWRYQQCHNTQKR